MPGRSTSARAWLFGFLFSAVIVGLVLTACTGGHASPLAPVVGASAPRASAPSATALPVAKVSVTVPVASPNPLDIGDNLTMNVSASGGSGVYTYQWLGLPSGCASENSSSLSCQVNTVQTTNVTVIATDSGLRTGTSGNLTLIVRPWPTVHISTKSSSSTAPDTVILTTDIQGGVDPFAAVWAFGDNQVGNGLNVTHTYETAGTYVVSVAITDTRGSVSQAATVLVVNWSAPPAGPSLPPVGPTGTIGLPPLTNGAGIAVIVAGAIGIFLILRRRRKDKAPIVPPLPKAPRSVPPNPYVPPGPPERTAPVSKGRLHL